MTICFENLISLVNTYNPEEVEGVTEVYNLALKLHDGQFRESGEPYIVHPLWVAYILAEMHADGDTLKAALLHDVLEDTDITKEDIVEQFGKEVAKLVFGVTKISKLDFSGKKELTLANTRKIITSITEDVRIIIIKLADRLHNMRTLNFKSEFKQKENAIETMEIFVPLAYYIGAYKLKSELEDLSLQYLKPDLYKKLKEKAFQIRTDSEPYLYEMLETIKLVLESKSIPNEIKIRTKNIYGIYKRISEGHKINEIHDLLAVKIMLEDIASCYSTLGIVHAKYYPINSKFKDYICNPKTNMYRSIHTTVFGPDDRLVQTQIRTFEMEDVATYGLTSYWSIEKGQARETMQKNLHDKFQFFKSLREMDLIFSDNDDFVNQVKNELFSTNIYVYTKKGEIVELPKGASVIDLAYRIGSDIGNTLVAAEVNDEIVSVDYILKNKDRVRVITDILSYGPREEWTDKVITSGAKKRIKEFIGGTYE